MVKIVYISQLKAFINDDACNKSTVPFGMFRQNLEYLGWNFIIYDL